MGAEVGLGEGDGERGIGGEIEGGVTFAPVPSRYLSELLNEGGEGMWVLDHCDVHWSGGARAVDLLVNVVLTR